MQNGWVGALSPDYDSDPSRWGSWDAPQDVHDLIAPELRGPVLDGGCGDGRLASLVFDREVAWVGVDSSPTQLAANPFRPLVLGDMGRLPFRDDVFGEVTHLWCLYHLDEPTVAIGEAKRVLRPGGRCFAATSARDNDPELVPEGYPASPFDAEEAAEIVTVGRVVFGVDEGVGPVVLADGVDDRWGPWRRRGRPHARRRRWRPPRWARCRGSDRRKVSGSAAIIRSGRSVAGPAGTGRRPGPETVARALRRFGWPALVHRPRALPGPGSAPRRWRRCSRSTRARSMLCTPFHDRAAHWSQRPERLTTPGRLRLQDQAIPRLRLPPTGG